MERLRKGLEIEFSYRAPVFDTDLTSFKAYNVSPDSLMSNLFTTHFLPAAENLGWRKNPNDTRLWLFNGSCFYLEASGKHPELASAECDLIKDLVAQVEAGVELAARLLERSVLALGEKRKRLLVKPPLLFRANRDSQNNFCAEQENFAVEWALLNTLHNSAATPTKIWNTFMMVTMPLWGSGDFSFSKETGAISYLLSQRIQKIPLKSFDPTWGSADFALPLLVGRSELLSDCKVRLQLSRDATPSQYATLLKLGTAELLLKVLGNNYLDLPWFDARRYVSGQEESLTYVELAHAISQDIKLEKRWPVCGEEMPLIQINRLFYQKLVEFYSRYGLSEEERLIFQVWNEAIEDLEKFQENSDTIENHSRLARRMDWAVKRKVVERLLKKYGLGWNDVLGQEATLDRESRARLFSPLTGIGSQYHNILPPALLAGIFNPQADRDELVSAEEIAQAHLYPPATTARKRALALRTLKEQKEKDNCPWSGINIDWQSCEVQWRKTDNNYINHSRRILWDQETCELTPPEIAFLEFLRSGPKEV